MSWHCREDDDDGGGPPTQVSRESIDDNPTGVGRPGRPCLRWTSRNVFFVTQRKKRKAAEAMRHLPAVPWSLPQQFCSGPARILMMLEY